MADTKKTASTVSEVKTEAPKAAEPESVKKTSSVSVKASEKTPAASSAKEKIVKGAEKVAEKAARGVEKVAEKAGKSAEKTAEKAEETAEKAAKSAEKTAEKATKSVEKKAKSAENSVKATVKKLSTARRKASPAKIESTVYLQFDNKSISAESLVDRVKEIWKEKKRKVSDLKDVKVYVNVAESKAYYVVNGDTLGDFEI